jgi:hypothetical protein
MIPHGIPVAQIDSGLEGDPKFLRLRMKAPDAYYAALGTYASIVLRAWATASRTPDPDLLALMDESVLVLLREFALLDESSAIPERVFDKWPGSVLESRDSRAAQLASVASEGGKARARGPRDAMGRLVSPAVVSSRPAVPLDDPAVPTLLSSTSSTPTTTPIEDDGEVQEGLDDPVVTYYSLTTRYPKGNALSWCKRLGDTYGFAASSEKMRAAWHAEDNIGTLLSRTEDYLVAAGRTAELQEAADERERLRQKRATSRAPVDLPAPERVGALMDDIRKQLGR